MANKLDKLIVIDVEATCWMGPPPQGMTNDIIEIGIAEIDVLDRVVTKSEGILVIPTNSTLSGFCKKLTTLTPEMIEEHGISFREACARLKQDYVTHKRPWASWGDFDRLQFRRQCRREKVRYPFGKTHLNAKDLFSLTYRLQKELGMANALEYLNMPLDGTHHRGIDDAKNIANLLIEALWNRPSIGEMLAEREPVQMRSPRLVPQWKTSHIIPPGVVEGRSDVVG